MVEHNNNGNGAVNGSQAAREDVVERPEPLPTPTLPDGTVPSNPVGGQATLIEQSRAQQQVNVQALLARQFPRDLQHVTTMAQDACQRYAVAKRAFFKYPRSGKAVTGLTIHIARELARCWGNLDYGIAELKRDSTEKRSEMMAWAWDLETNARVSNIFIVPHSREKDGEMIALSMARDLYEHNANLGARRLRECIFNVLPDWLVAAAEEECKETLQHGADRHGGGAKAKPLAERIEDCIHRFARLGVTVEQLEAHVSKTRDQWGKEEISELGTTYTSLKEGSLTKEQAFEEVSTTAEEILAQANEARNSTDGDS